MPKVHYVKRAQKDYLEAGISKGESYYWWEFRYGGKHKSKTYPKPQQLTQSDFWIQVYDIQDNIEALTYDSVEDDLQNIIDEIRYLADEQEEKLYNMPDGLQEGDVGQLLQERNEALNEWADNLENVDLELNLEDEPDRNNYENGIEGDIEYENEQADWESQRDDRQEEIINELQGYSYEGN